MRAPPVLPGSSISSLQDIKTKSVPRYRYSLGIFERSSEGKGEKQKKQTKRLLAGKERVNSCYACAHGPHRVGGDGRRLPGAMFSPEVPSLLRADAFSLPHLSSPLPVPVRVLVPGWCFLVTAAAVSMCVTDPEQPWPGDPLSALRLARRAVERARVPSPASASPICPLLVAGRGLWPLSGALPQAARLTAWGVCFSLRGQSLRS